MPHSSSVFAALLSQASELKSLSLLAQLPLRVAAAYCFLLSLTALPAHGQTCTPPPPGMIAWWPGDGNANDLAGSNPATLVNGATYAAGRVSQAFSLDGQNDGISIQKGAGSALNLGGSDFTIDAWVRFTQIVGGSAPIFTNYAGVPHYTLRVDQNGRAQLSFRPGVAIVGGNNPTVTATGTRVLNDGQWHHIAGVRSRAAVLIYVDGQIDGFATNPAVLNVNWGVIDTTNCGFARIGSTHTNTGHCNSSNPNPAEARFRGLIDEVEIFNRALCATEIEAIFNAGPAGKCK